MSLAYAPAVDLELLDAAVLGRRTMTTIDIAACSPPNVFFFEALASAARGVTVLEGVTQ